MTKAPTQKIAPPIISQELPTQTGPAHLASLSRPLADDRRGPFIVRFHFLSALLLFFLTTGVQTAPADQAAIDRIAAVLEQLSPNVAPKAEQDELGAMLGRSLRAKI